MRALMLTQDKGAPQGWAQDFMMLAAWAVSLNLVLALLGESLFGLLGRATGGFVSIGITTALETIFLFLLQGSVAAVIVSLFLQTPETCQPCAECSLIPGFKMPGRA